MVEGDIFMGPQIDDLDGDWMTLQHPPNVNPIRSAQLPGYPGKQRHKLRLETQIVGSLGFQPHAGDATQKLEQSLTVFTDRQILKFAEHLFDIEAFGSRFGGNGNLLV